MTRIGGTDRVTGAEAGSVRAVEGLCEYSSSFSSLCILTTVSETRRPSPTSDEKRVRACSTAGPIIILERSSDRSIPFADGILPNRGFAAFDETLIRVSTFKPTAGFCFILMRRRANEIGDLPGGGKVVER